jgi:hypothetical protein
VAVPLVETLVISTREDRAILLINNVDMTGWTLQAELKDDDALGANVLATKVTGAGITITGTDAVLDFRDGTTYNLSDRTYWIYVRRLVAGVRVLAKVIRFVVKERGG